MRMFVAVRPPEEVIASLARFVEPRQDVESELRWTRPESWHITLAFLPDVAEAGLERLSERLGDTARAGLSLSLALAGSGSFPNPAKAKLLWVGVTGDTQALPQLAGNVRSAANRAGTQVEGGPYRPHLTLARIGRPQNVTRWLEIFDLYRSESWRVEDIVLYQSHLGAGPAQYQEIERFRLGRS